VVLAERPDPADQRGQAHPNRGLYRSACRLPRQRRCLADVLGDRTGGQLAVRHLAAGAGRAVADKLGHAFEGERLEKLSGRSTNWNTTPSGERRNAMCRPSIFVPGSGHHTGSPLRSTESGIPASASWTFSTRNAHRYRPWRLPPHGTGLGAVAGCSTTTR